MAATAVYANLYRVPTGSMPDDGISFSNIAATTAAFLLRGGRYGFTVVGSTFGTVTLQVLGANGTTWLNALTAISANGVASGDLPPGQYRIALA